MGVLGPDTESLSFMMPEDPMARILDSIRDMVGELRPGQSLAIQRVPGSPKPGSPLFTVYTQGTVTLSLGEGEKP